MHSWNKRQGAESRKRLGIMMPTDMQIGRLRDAGGEPHKLTFLSRTARWGSPDELLATIQAETARIKSHRSGTKFMSAVSWLSRLEVASVRGFTKYLFGDGGFVECRGPQPAFYGEISPRRRTHRKRQSHARIDHGRAATPPENPRDFFDFAIYPALTVSLRCDPSCFALKDMAALLDLYIERLRQSAIAAYIVAISRCEIILLNSFFVRNALMRSAVFAVGCILGGIFFGRHVGSLRTIQARFGVARTSGA